MKGRCLLRHAGAESAPWPDPMWLWLWPWPESMPMPPMPLMPPMLMFMPPMSMIGEVVVVEVDSNSSDNVIGKSEL